MAPGLVRKKERREGAGGAEYACGVMLMSLQLHDCPLWPSVALPAIDQGRVSRSLAARSSQLAASQCALGRWRDEFISSAAAAAVLADGSGAVDTGRNYFLIAGSFGGTRSGLFYVSVILCTSFSREVGTRPRYSLLLCVFGQSAHDRHCKR